MSYRMSYRLSVGPPKDKTALQDDEGLTDRLVVCSILGLPGGETATSFAPMILGPDGLEPLHGPTFFSLATLLLHLLVESETLQPDIHRAAVRALICLRKPFRQK